MRFTDTEGYFVSEGSVYRLLKALDPLASPAYIVVKAAEERDFGCTVSVKTAYGSVTSVEHGVKTWLASTEGIAFAERRPREVGKFTSEIRALSRAALGGSDG